MPIEIERKYLLENEEKNKLLDNFDSEKVGIIQWYLDGGVYINSSVRIRLMIRKENGKFVQQWIYGKKTVLNNSLETREEKEFVVGKDEFDEAAEIKDLIFNSDDKLKSYPFVIKTRNIIHSISSVEIVLDTFINLPDIFFSDANLMEIELKDSENKTLFESTLNKINVIPKIDLTDSREYTNHRIALKSFEKYGEPHENISDLISILEREVIA